MQSEGPNPNASPSPQLPADSPNWHTVLQEGSGHYFTSAFMSYEKNASDFNMYSFMTGAGKRVGRWTGGMNKITQALKGHQEVIQNPSESPMF